MRYPTAGRRLVSTTLCVLALLLAATACASSSGSAGGAAMARQSDLDQAQVEVRLPGERLPGELPTLTVTEPAAEATVESPFLIRVDVDGFQTAASGATNDGEAHIHILVDRPCLPTGSVIPADANHIHWGDGSAAGMLELRPGRHELCVQLGDGFHAAVAVHQTITVNVLG